MGWVSKRMRQFLLARAVRFFGSIGLAGALLLPQSSIRSGVAASEQNPASNANQIEGPEAHREWAGEEFSRAKGKRIWKFPRDHGQHPGFRLEWWYYTGIVRDGQGRPFGFQVTFFRQGLAPPVTAPASARSAWRVGSLYLAHFAVSDLTGKRFLHAERTGRDSLGLSGAAPDRHQVWLGDWRAEANPSDAHGTDLRVQDSGFGLSLDLRSDRDPVFHGEAGLDRKGREAGQASWYYSQPRLHAAGALRIGSERWTVTGMAWMDHEFGTSQLSSTQVGWDWFALRLANGADLMLYRLREANGAASETSGGTLVTPDGKAVRIILGKQGKKPADESGGKVSRVEAEPMRHWASPLSNAHYPLAWTLRIPDYGAELRIRPALENQELPPGTGLPFGYWEGAVWVQGQWQGQPVGGEGYLELTGYAGDLGGAFR
jgi:predicted secreted hydrolase